MLGTRQKQFEALVGKTVTSVEMPNPWEIILVDSEGNRHVIRVELDGHLIPHLLISKDIED